MDEFLRNFERYMHAAWRFSEEIAQAERRLEAGDLTAARRQLEEDLVTIPLRNPQLQEQLDDFRRRLGMVQVRTDYEEQMITGRHALREEAFPNAQYAFEAARRVLNSSEATFLPQAERRSMGGQLTRAEEILTLRRSYRTFIQDAAVQRDSATGTRQGQIQAVTAAMGQAQQLRELLGEEEWNELRQSGGVTAPEDLQLQIDVLRATVSLERGRTLLLQGRYDEAIVAFEESLSHHETQEATESLILARNQREFDEIVAQASQAEDAGRLDEAVTLLETAQQLHPDDADLQLRIQRIRYELQLAEARRLEREGELEAAIAAYGQAQRLFPQNTDNLPGVMGPLQRTVDFRAAMARGDASLEQGDYEQARTEYRAAGDVATDAQRDRQWRDAVEQRMEHSHYLENIERGRQAMDRGDYNGALFSLKLALQYEDTPELRALITEAERHVEN